MLKENLKKRRIILTNKDNFGIPSEHPMCQAFKMRNALYAINHEEYNYDEIKSSIDYYNKMIKEYFCID